MIRLLQTASENWFAFDAWCLYEAHVEPLDLTPSRLVTLIHVWALLSIHDEQERRQFEAWLNEPMPGTDPDDVTKGPWSGDEEMALFRAAGG